MLKHIVDGEVNLIFGHPYDYKGMKIYPAKLPYYNVVKACQNSLSVSRSHERDIGFLQMSYLEYIYKKSLVDVEMYQTWNFLNCLLSISFQTENISYRYKDDLFVLLVTQESVEYEFSCAEFEDIKSIICELNDIPIEIIDAEWEKRLQEAQGKLGAANKGSGVNLRDLIISLGVYMNKLPHEFEGMTISDFDRYCKMYIERDEYSINKTAEMSGNVTFSKKISHWLAHYKVKGKYSSVLTDSLQEDVLDGLR